MIRRFALVLGLLASTALFASPAEQAQAITVTGRVVADGTEAPIRRAWVVVRSTDGKTVRVGATDLNGEFRFDGLPQGQYRVGASKPPYLAAAAEVAGARIVLRLTMGATVFGVVTELGKPMKDVRIALSGPSLVPRSATSDARGEFRIHGLPGGEYELTTARSQPRTVTLSAGEAVQALPIELHEATVYTEVAPTSVSGGTASVGGRVLDVRTGQPLAGIQVNLGRTGTTTNTDSAGRFRFDKLRAATYGLMAQQPGYSSLATATVVAEATTNISDVVLRLGRHASMTGTVRDDMGDPVVGMPVMAYRKSMLGLRPVSVGTAPVLTNERGTYRIDGLIPGDYIVCACADRPLGLDPLLRFVLGLTESSVAQLANDIDETVMSFPPTYAPGSTRGNAGQVVAVDYGDERLGIDISVYGVKPFTVTGQVLDKGRPPSDPPQLRLFPAGDLSGAMFISEPAPITVSADGAFRVRGVAPGRYTLLAASETDASAPVASAEVQVEDKDVDGVIVTLADLPAVEGRIEFSGRSSAPDSAALSKATISLLPTGMFSLHQLFMAATSGGIGSSATPDANGRFTIKGVRPGEYIVSVRVPGSNWRTVERLMTSDGGVNLDGLLTVASEGSANVLVIVSDAPLANLEGTATLERYETPGSMRVVVFPSDKSLWPDAQRHAAKFVFVFLNANRTFRFDAMPPGEYFVVLASGAGFEMSMEQMERWSSSAQRVRLRAGETMRVDVRNVR